MARVIDQFLVGIGFEADKKGVSNVLGAFSSISGSAARLGPSLAAAFAGGVMALQAMSKEAREFANIEIVSGVKAANIKSLTGLYEQAGGSAENAIALIDSLNKAQALVGTGRVQFVEEAGRAGVDAVPILEAQDAMKGLLILADKLTGKTRQQKTAIGEAFGLDEASIRLLSSGSAELSNMLKEQEKVSPKFQELADSSKEFNHQLVLMQQNIGGVADAFTAKLLPNATNTLESINNSIKTNRDAILSVFDIPEQASKFLVSGIIGAATGSEQAGADVAKTGASVLTSIAAAAVLLPERINATLTELLIPGVGRSSIFPVTQEQREIAERNRALLKNEKTNVIVNVELDGQKMDARTRVVIQQENQAALDEINQ